MHRRKATIPRMHKQAARLQSLGMHAQEEDYCTIPRDAYTGGRLQSRGMHAQEEGYNPEGCKHRRKATIPRDACTGGKATLPRVCRLRLYAVKNMDAGRDYLNT
jgi:hypothetical protein